MNNYILDSLNVLDIKVNKFTVLLQKRKEGLLSDIDDALLKAVYEVLAIAEEVFDTLEFSSVPTLSVRSSILLPAAWYVD